MTLEELEHALKEAQQGTPEKSVESAIAIYHAAKSKVDAYNAIGNRAKAIVTDVMTETGEMAYKTPAGNAQVTAPSVSVSYDSKALDALMASDDNVARLLEPHRRVSERAGTLRITAKK